MNAQKEHEEWEPYPSCPRYFGSSLGRVRGPSGKVLSPGFCGSGYLIVVVCTEEGVRKTTTVHKIISDSFLPAAHGTEVNHKDGDKGNNRLSNLERVSRSENQLHAVAHGLKPWGEASHKCTKLNADKVTEIVQLGKTGLSQQKIAAIFRISQTYVSKLLCGKKWRILTKKLI